MPCRAVPLVLAAAALALASPAAPAAGAAGASWQPGVAAARAWAATRQGSIAFAVRTGDRVVGVGLDRPYPSASVVKAMLLVAYLREPGVRRRALRDEERALLGPMVRRSSNRAATEIRNRVGNAGLERLARATGMRSFRTAPNWGSSTITARDQTRFFLHIDGHVPARHRDYAMHLLATIVPRQRWGIARAVPTAWTLWFKGGWGSGSGAVDHQVGLLRQPGERIAIAVLTLSTPSHAYGRATEEGLARRLLAGLDGDLLGTVGRTRAGLPRPRAAGAASQPPHNDGGRPAGRPRIRLRGAARAYSSAAGGWTAGWSSAPPSSTLSGSSPSLRAPTPTGVGFGSGLTMVRIMSRSSSSGAGSTITVAPGSSSARSTKSASGSSM
jgi:hypothetical protein